MNMMSLKSWCSHYPGVQFEVFAHLKWADQIFVEGSSNLLNYEMLIDGNVENTGSVDLNAERELPEKISCGFGTMDTTGKHVVSVKVTIDAFESESDRDYQSFASGASFVPLIIVLLLAGTTHMVSELTIRGSDSSDWYILTVLTLPFFFIG